jgi:rubrerythrin
MNDGPHHPKDNGDGILQVIQDAIRGEEEARALYACLISEAPSAIDKKIIAGIIEDEIRHFGMFRQLYYAESGCRLPECPGSDFVKPASYGDGLKAALAGKRDTVGKYRSLLFALRHRRDIRMVAEIIADELRHVALFNFLLRKAFR